MHYKDIDGQEVVVYHLDSARSHIYEPMSL